MGIAAIEEATRRIDQRLEELRPLIDEYRTLEGVRQQMAQAIPKNGCSPESEPTVTIGGRNRSRKGETMQAVRQIVVDHPEGITVPNIAEKLGKHPSYVYAVVSKLIERNVVVREGHLVRPRVRKAVLAG